MTSHQRSVLVIGATGQQGGATARALRRRGWAVRALVRDPGKPIAQQLLNAGASPVTGDLDDRDSVQEALRSCYGVFLVLTMMSGHQITPEGVAAEQRRGEAVAELAREAGIAHLVYSSIRGAGQHTGIAHVESKARIEERIAACGTPATILRPASFMGNFASYNRPTLDDGELVVSLAVRPQTPVALVATRDIGEFAAIAFDQPERYIGRQIELAGDYLTGPEIAAEFARASGLSARFQQVPIERLRAFDEELAKQYEWMDRRGTDPPDLTALRAEHPGLMTLRDWLQSTGWTPAP